MKSTKNLFVLFSLLIVVAMVLSACGTPAVEAPVAEEPVAEEPMEEEDTGAIVAEEATPTAIVLETSEYGEAPMLAEMVAAGDLPPVEERLPIADDIMVVSGVDGIGEYGGIWHGVSWEQQIPNIKMALYDPPVRWNRAYTGYEPGLLKSWEVSEDGKTLTWVFRQGIKWSDGVDFIPSEDMAFWWNDLALNEDVKFIPVPWWGFDSDGTPMEVTFPDDYTMVMNWGEPHYIATYIVAQGFWEWDDLHQPKHFISQYHPDYNSDATYDDLEEAAGEHSWVNFEGHPCLMAWCLESFTPGERVILARNPYYWKVDAEGNQLPYMDKVNIVVLADAEVRVLEASQGKFEATFRATDDPVNIPFLLEQAEAGDYHIHSGAVNGAGSYPGWLVNMNFADSETYPDTWEEIRDLLDNQDFRIGLSHALDRQRLIDVVWDGIGYPTNATISPQAWHFASPEGKAVYEAWRDAYVEYDPDLAAEHFDAAGFVDADGDGFRDLPSGAEFTMVLDLGDWGGGGVVAATEVYAGNLEDLGVQVLINDLRGQPDWDLRQKQGLFMLRNMHASELDIWTYPDWIFPLRDERSWPMEGKYRMTGGEEGWEPQPGTTYALELQQLYDLGLATADINERHQIVWDAIQVHIDHGPFMIGGSGDQNMPVVVRNGFMGIPDLVILGPWAPASPGNLNPEQFWMQEDLRMESLE